MTQIVNTLSSTPAMFVWAAVAFVLAALLVFFLVRTLFGGKLRLPSSRARQARLGIVDAFDLDRQRQLIIIRRDNTEHLIMIGGPNDLVIEPEIVRVEAREARAREAGFGDARIPAPFTPADRVEPRSSGEGQSPPVAPPPVDEPTLPLPLPEVASVSAAEPTPAPRGPTFPLPARRPVPAERRAPLPPRLPETVTRGAEPAAAGAAPPPQVVPPQVVPPTVTGTVTVPAAAPAPAPEGPPPAPPAAPSRPVPSFRPLTPRPPVRPLQRVTPKPAGTPGVAAQAPAASAPQTPTAPAEAEAAAEPTIDKVLPAAPAQAPAAPAPAPAAPPPPPPAPPAAVAPAAAMPPPAESGDDDLSLEEEMAKLLGRG